MVSVKQAIPYWSFSTAWISGICRIDNGPCEYQITIRSVRTANGFPDVTVVESTLKRFINESATTAEELFARVSNDFGFGCYAIRVKCRSGLHGELEVGHE